MANIETSQGTDWTRQRFIKILSKIYQYMYLEKFNSQSKFDLEINRDHTLSRAPVYFIKQ